MSRPQPPRGFIFESWVQGLGFRILGVWVQGLGFRILGVWVQGLGFRILGFRFRILGFRFRILGFRFRIWGFRFRVLGSGFSNSGLEESKPKFPRVASYRRVYAAEDYFGGN